MTSEVSPPPSAATGLGPQDTEYPRVLDPWSDCPDKLIWLLYGWLTWNDRIGTYAPELRELHRMLTERLAMLDWAEKSKQ